MEGNEAGSQNGTSAGRGVKYMDFGARTVRAGDGLPEKSLQGT